MRPDGECLTAYVKRQFESLRELPASVLVGAVRISEKAFVCNVRATYLGVTNEEPARLAASANLPDMIAARTWQPKEPDDVVLTHADLNVLVELLAGERAAPAVYIMPGEYPAVLHPHVEPLLPGMRSRRVSCASSRSRWR